MIEHDNIISDKLLSTYPKNIIKREQVYSLAKKISELTSCTMIDAIELAIMADDMTHYSSITDCANFGIVISK